MASISVHGGSLPIDGNGPQSPGNDSTIAGLKQKLAELTQELKDVLNNPSEKTMARAKSIQMKIQILQDRLEYLIQQAATKNSRQQAKPVQNTSMHNDKPPAQIDIFV